ncbi:unnamed protein product [Calypogeia fissa]
MQHLRSKFAHGKRSVVDTVNSIKAVFEKHNVVFTIGASLASAGAAWAGYTARQIHQRKVEDRLNSLEHVMTTVHNLEEEQVKALTKNVGVSYTACAATAGTTLVIGYGLGFRGGRWFAIKRFQRQQQKQQQKLLQTAYSSSTSPPKKYLETLRLGSSTKSGQSSNTSL